MIPRSTTKPSLSHTNLPPISLLLSSFVFLNMKPDSEEKRDGRQKPNSPSTNEDESARIEVNTPTNLPPTSANTNELGESVCTTLFESPPLDSVDQNCDDLTQPLGNNKEAKTENVHNSHPEVEIATMSSSDLKEDEGKAQDTSGTDSDQDQEGTPGPLSYPTPLEKSLALPPLMKKTGPDHKERVEDTSDHDSYGDSSSSSSTEDPYDVSQPVRKKPDRVSSWAKPVVSKMEPEDVDDDSPSRLEWLRQKRENNEKNRFLDQLMSMVGLEDVKAHFLAVKARVQARAQAGGHGDAKQPDLRLHMVLQGKDGTGKKSIAKLYAQFLYSIGAVETKVTDRVSSLDSFNPRYSGTGYQTKNTQIFFNTIGDETPEPEADSPPAPPKKSSNPSVLFYDKSGSPSQRNSWDDNYGMGIFTRSKRQFKADMDGEKARPGDKNTLEAWGEICPGSVIAGQVFARACRRQREGSAGVSSTIDHL